MNEDQHQGAQEANEQDQEDEHETLEEETDEDEPMGPDDSRRMDLLEDEMSWALVIKEVVEADPEINNLSDYEYAQFSIVDYDEHEHFDVERVVHRIQQFQAIREEYKIVENIDCARRVIHKALDLYGGHFLGFSFNQEHGSYVMVVDQSQIPTLKALKSQTEGVMLRLQEMYYINHVMCPDFESIRNGYIIISECGNVSSREQCLSLGLLQDMLHLTDVFPTKLTKNMNYHGSLFSNLLLSMAKKVMPKLRSVIEVGHTFEGGSLNDFYLVPSPDIARRRLTERLDKVFQKRYKNEAEFRLKPDD